MAGVAQRTVYRLRRDVDQKLGRLPLKYFDTHARGDTLSRVTNDIDNIANTLQQSLTQIITSFATIIGVLAMMFWISPMLAVISLLVLPTAAILTMLIARQSQKQFASQWERPGILNGHVEESHTGHAIVKVFGHQEDAIRKFDEENQRVYEASFRAQFISGHHHAGDDVRQQPQLRRHRRASAASRWRPARCPSATCRRSSSTRARSPSRSPRSASIANLLQSTMASAERVFELLDEPEEIADAGAAGGPRERHGPRRPRGRGIPIRAETAAHRRPQRRRPIGRGAGHRRPDRRRQDHRRQPADALLRHRLRHDQDRRHRNPAS